MSASASPSAGAPTASYDVRLLDQTGYDVLEGLGADRSAVASEHKALIYASTSLHPVVDDSDALTLRIDNNGVGSAYMEIALYYALGY